MADQLRHKLTENEANAAHMMYDRMVRAADPYALDRTIEFFRLEAVRVPVAPSSPAPLDTQIVDALENREVQIECMGTTVPYINIYPKRAGVKMQTTAGNTQTLRQAMAKVLV